MPRIDADCLGQTDLHQLVENRTTFTLRSAALNLFETHRSAEAVHLKFDQPVLASMLLGRKVMHLRSRPGFTFLPGESVVMPADEQMIIDFPDAREGRPTKCLALEIDPGLISNVAQNLNERRERSDGSEWQRSGDNFHFTHDAGINQLIQRLVYLCAEDHPAKDLFVDMALRELLIRLLELESRHSHLAVAAERAGGSPISAAIEYVRSHLDEQLNVKSLSRVACMSESSFYRAFRNEMSLTPIDFINTERTKRAAQLLRGGELTVSQIALRCGFTSANYFTRVFKKFYGTSPRAFQQRG